MFCILSATLVSVVLLLARCFGQSVVDLQQLATPQELELSADGSRLWYRLGPDWWGIDTAPNSQPERDSKHQSPEAGKPPQVSDRLGGSIARTSPNGKWIAYLDGEHPYGPQLLFRVRTDQHGSPQTAGFVAHADSRVREQFSSTIGSLQPMLPTSLSGALPSMAASSS